MDNTKYKISKHSVHNINYHIVFCPKRRRPVLVGNIAKDVEQMFAEIISQIGCGLEKISIMPDHVHLFVSASPIISPHKIVKELKGRTAGVLRSRYTELLKIPTMWSRSYYIGSVGFVSETVVKSYIENQKGK